MSADISAQLVRHETSSPFVGSDGWSLSSKSGPGLGKPSYTLGYRNISPTHPRNSGGFLATLNRGAIIFYYSQSTAASGINSPARLGKITYTTTQGATLERTKVVSRIPRETT